MGEANHSGPKKLEIKKYPNRRYYDATHSRHLTLEEIRSLVQQGHDIQVIDAKTGQDITGQVLTQIILELDTPKLDSLPVPLLVRLIRMNDQLIKDFIEKYFNQALNSFLGYQKQLEEQIRQTHGLPAAFPSVTAWTKAVLEPFTAAFTKPGTEQATETASASSDEAPNVRLQRMVEELQQQVSELKKARKASGSRKGGRKRERKPALSD